MATFPQQGKGSRQAASLNVSLSLEIQSETGPPAQAWQQYSSHGSCRCLKM